MLKVYAVHIIGVKILGAKLYLFGMHTSLDVKACLMGMLTSLVLKAHLL